MSNSPNKPGGIRIDKEMVLIDSGIIKVDTNITISGIKRRQEKTRKNAG